MKRILFPISIITALVFFQSCALIITGPKQRVLIVSDQPGSEVYLNGKFKDTTPCEVKVKRSWGTAPEIDVKKTGYVTQTVKLKKRFNEISTLNFLLIINWGIDIATGAIWKYQQPDTFHLQPKRKIR